VNHLEGSFSGVRNTRIYHQAWLPDGPVKAVLVLVHGIGEHSGRYLSVVNHFVPLGYAVYDGLYHEVFNEPERARVLHDVETWLAAHL
jgi:alpha-beta hydrolase superfamily lysophospholipase